MRKTLLVILVPALLAVAGPQFVGAHGPPALTVASQEALGTLAPPGDNGFEFVGSRACRRCHIVAYRTWEETAHAKAFELLSPGVRPDAKRKVNLVADLDYRENEYCLRCHTVGYQRSGGFANLEETPDRIGVGCEACHGAGGGYIADDVMGKDNQEHSFAEVLEQGLIWPVPEETCRVCHGGDTPFNAEIFPEYTLEYSRETLGTEVTHDHRAFRYQHGPLPEGVLFQDEYPGGVVPPDGEPAPTAGERSPRDAHPDLSRRPGPRVHVAAGQAGSR